MSSKCLAVLGVLTIASVAECRPIKLWTYADLVSASDVVVVATPTSTRRTERVVPPTIGTATAGPLDGPRTPIPYREVVTTFRVDWCLKGRLEPARTLDLHHYAFDSEPSIRVNTPHFVTFDVQDEASYLMFLVRADSTLVPTGGLDAAMCIWRLDRPRK